MSDEEAMTASMFMTGYTLDPPEPMPGRKNKQTLKEPDRTIPWKELSMEYHNRVDARGDLIAGYTDESSLIVTAHNEHDKGRLAEG